MDEKKQAKAEKEKEKKIDEITSREGRVTMETMSAVGKKVTLAGREYLVAPITLIDLDVLESSLILPIMGNKEIDDIYFAGNVTNESNAKLFYYIVKKYVKYGEDKMPVTKEMLNEHNWSIKDIRHFLEVWLQVSD